MQKLLRIVAGCFLPHPGQGRNGLTRLRRWLGSATGGTLLLTLFTILATANLWRMEISHGDTANYYARAKEWAANGFFLKLDYMVYSPLYTILFSWLQRLVPEAGAATMLQQFAVALLGGLATLAAARQVVPRGWAWLTAAWWVAINWHIEFEVHLFGYAVLAFGAGLAGSGRSLWRRGGALALLAMGSFLVRNEFLPAVPLFGALCLVPLWKGKPWRERWSALGKLALPSFLVALFFVWMFSGRSEQLSLRVLKACLERRHRDNMVQVYSFGYQQRHTDWTGNPWTGGGELMQRDFGNPSATFSEGLRVAPGKIIEHVLWNFRLIPDGLQLSLFGSYGGPQQPDFSPKKPPGMPNPILRSLLMLALWAGGVWALWDWRQRHPRFFLRGSPGIWTWLYLACCLPSVGIAIVTQRPRPAYIEPLTLLLMLFTVLSAALLLRRLRRLCPGLGTTLPWVPAAIGLLSLLVVPATRPGPTPQPLLDDLRRLENLHQVLRTKNRVLASNAGDPLDVAAFLCDGQHLRWRNVGWEIILTPMQAGATLEEALTKAAVTDVYIRHDGFSPYANGLDPHLFLGGDWRQVAISRDPHAGWEYWARPRNLPSSAAK